MSVIAVGGRRFAAGLYWLARVGPGATARAARRLGRPWCVHRGSGPGSRQVTGRTLPRAPALRVLALRVLALRVLALQVLAPSGLPALALALLDHVDGEFWMALVEGEADGGQRRYALVKARGGAVLADGDEVFGERAAALAAFERARALGWALHATPGLLAELRAPGSEVAALDAAAIAEAASRAGAAIELSRTAAGRRQGRRRLSAALGLAVLAAITGAWLGRDALVQWLAGPVAEVGPAVLRPEPTAAVAVDGAALIAACRRALIERPPFLPGWRIERIACAARFADPELTGLRPELAGRPVLLVRWRLRPGHAAAMQRRLAENHLARWHAGAVADGRAWAVAPLAPVLRIADEAVPPFLALRKAVDGVLGARGARLGYARDAKGAWTVRIDDPGPLSWLIARAGGIAGLELTALTRGAEGGWRLEGRPAAPVTVAASQLRALGVVSGEAPGEGAASGHIGGTEGDDGTDDGG